MNEQENKQPENGASSEQPKSSTATPQSDALYPNLTGKRIIVLAGTSNSGKTSTLNELAALFQRNPGFTPIGGPNPALSGWTDTKYLFSWNHGVRTVTIGISTAGDTPDAIDDGFNYFNTHNCDIGFIAAKSKWSSVDRIEHICQPLGIKPRYLFLMTEWNQDQVRTRPIVYQDVATDLLAQL
ncbi:MAG: hypothetical protein IKO40_12685 [Kiritimatiellae bacterium]|nr:hypothetical protein [Kiritimatiellia bacterium]